MQNLCIYNCIAVLNSHLYGSKSVPSGFENKNTLNYKHWIFMHWNNLSDFFASEFNSLHFHIHLYLSMLKNSTFKNSTFKYSSQIFSTSQNSVRQSHHHNSMYEIQC